MYPYQITEVARVVITEVARVVITEVARVVITRVFIKRVYI